jgi:prophage tail gpP-like protein
VPTLDYVIIAANPGVVEPLLLGTILTIPEDPLKPSKKPFSPLSDNPNELNLLINGEQFKFWESMSITRSIDSFDTISITGPFDLSFKKFFVPMSFASIDVAIGGDYLFSGTAVNVIPKLSVDREEISIEGYSKPGVLNDCTLPPSEWSRTEFRDVALDAIAQALLAPFGLTSQFDVSPGPNFQLESIARTRKVLDFLTELAHKKGLIIGNTPEGKLLFTQSRIDGVITANLEEDQPPLIAAETDFNSQEYYSDIVGMNGILTGTAPIFEVAKNPRLRNVVRPFVFQNNGLNSTELAEAAKAKLGRMFANSVSYTIEVNTWRDANNKLWSPNTFLILKAPSIMIYEKYRFLVRSVEFNKSVTNGETTKLTLVLPGAFSGEAPETLPWD